MKFHHHIFNDFQVTELIQLECKFCYFAFQKVITPKILNPESWFLYSAHRLTLVNNPVKF